MEALNEGLLPKAKRGSGNGAMRNRDASKEPIHDHYALHLFAGIYCLLAWLQRLSAHGGDSIEQYFVRYPFLQAYQQQLLLVMPKTLDWQEGRRWWQKNLAGFTAPGLSVKLHLPLKILEAQQGLRHENLMALMLIGLVEEDSRFGTLFAELQQPLSFRRPMLETLGHIVNDDEVIQGKSPWDVCQPLLHNQLVHVENTQQPRAEWVLKVAPDVWDVIRTGKFSSVHAHYRYSPYGQLNALKTVLIEDALRLRLQAVPSLVKQKRLRNLVLRAPEGSHSVEVMGAIAHAIKKNLLLIENNEQAPSTQHDNVGILCTLSNTLPVFKFDLSSGETAALPRLSGYSGFIGIILGPGGGLDVSQAEQLVNLELDFPSKGQRESMWQHHLQGVRVNDVEDISRQFRVPGEFIKQIATIAKNNAALETRGYVDIDDIRNASRNLNRQKLDSLADRLEAKGSWAQLISVATTNEKLLELQQRCHHRETLLDCLGPAFKNASNCGVRALFTGRSGTGKTLAARILAAELGMDIYRVDLASIVNKYIGETEKNLNKVLTRAEALDVILLLDEGDSLLGGRTEVKNANDRYANLETNYLLQRLEHYHGIILVTTNLSDNIDKAFQRRMDIVIPFFQPQMEQRLAIFKLHLPTNHQIEDSFLEKVANYCNLMGGQIRNVCQHAALVALDDNSLVNKAHLEFSLRSEYRKNGSTYPMNTSQTKTADDGGLDTFIHALSRRV
jgi:ATPases of the AAA+ class